MWTRKELKARGKQAFSFNYWKTVLVALIIAGLIGSASGISGAASGSGGAFSMFTNRKETKVEESFSIDEGSGTLTITDEDGDSFSAPIDEIVSSEAAPIVGTFLMIIIFLAVLVVAAIAILLSAFLFNPLEVGCQRFFLQNLHTKAEVKEVAFGYDHGYKNNVKTLFLKNLYTFLWSLLFIIPGIVKAYEYRMMPYILAEHPDMPCNEVFALSKSMMKGQKWSAFVLDLSFIGWEILSAFTLGLLSVFYVTPWHSMTNAALYEALAYGTAPQTENTVWTES